MWDSLSIVWKACLEEAWASFVAGSVPIGALITDPEGTIIARGRNRVVGTGDSSLRGYRAPLAHAELNALLVLDFSTTDPKSCTLSTTLEPCPLCIGAIAVAGLQHVVFAAEDPYSGSVALLRQSQCLRRKHVIASRPSDRHLETLSLLLVAQFYLQKANGEDTGFLASLRRDKPNVLRMADSIFEAGLLSRMGRAGEPIQAVIELLASQYLAFG